MVRPIEDFDASGFPCAQGAELPADALNVRDIVPKSYRKATKVMARDIELAVGAAAAAVEDAGLVTKAVDPDAAPTYPPERAGCQIGAGLIAAEALELTTALAESRDEHGEFSLTDWGGSGMQNLTPLWLLKYLPNMLACHVTIVHDCHGPSNTITCGEASGVLSAGESMRVIQRGDADMCLTGGAENKINLMGLLRQGFAGRLAEVTIDDDGPAVVRPFASDARGGVLGNGGGIVVLEEEAAARSRDAAVYARLAGFASTQCFCPDTVGAAPDESGESLADAMERALRQAGCDPGDIDAIVPFGSAIPAVDRMEINALRRVFGAALPSIPLVTITPSIGALCAGHGAVQLIVGALCLKEQRLPARLNTSGAEGVDADAAPSRAADLRRVLVASTSLGGQNAAVVLERADVDQGGGS